MPIWLRHIYILFYILFHCGLSQDIEYSSLCYTLGPTLLSIHSKWSSLHLSTPNSQSMRLPPLLPIGNCKSVLCESVSVSQTGSFVPILDSTYRWYHMVLVFLFLTYCIAYDNLKLYPCCCKWHYSTGIYLYNWNFVTFGCLRLILTLSTSSFLNFRVSFLFSNKFIKFISHH